MANLAISHRNCSADTRAEAGAHQCLWLDPCIACNVPRGQGRAVEHFIQFVGGIPARLHFRNAETGKGSILHPRVMASLQGKLILPEIALASIMQSYFLHRVREHSQGPAVSGYRELLCCLA